MTMTIPADQLLNEPLRTESQKLRVLREFENIEALKEKFKLRAALLQFGVIPLIGKQHQNLSHQNFPFSFARQSNEG